VGEEEIIDSMEEEGKNLDKDSKKQ